MRYELRYFGFDSMENDIAQARTRERWAFDAATEAEAVTTAQAKWRELKAAPPIIGWDKQSYPAHPKLVAVIPCEFDE
jgi:hypothetical protein